MSAVEQVITQQQQQQQQHTDQTLSDSFASSGSDWGLLGDLMIDLSSADQQQQVQQQPPPLKMPTTEAVSAAENLAPPAKPDLAASADKGLKMKIKRKSKHEEKHEIVAAETPARDDLALADAAGPNAKKARVDKTDACKKKAASLQARRDASVNTATVGTSVEPDHLGPCDTGTNISLDGIVWLETTTGLLVVNVTWRGRTYVGTLLDSSQHDFAPPCPKDYVPPMETARNARGRGKRRPPGFGINGGSSGGVNGVSRGSRRLGRQLPLSSRGSDESDEGSRQDGKEDGAKSQSPPAAQQLRDQQQQGEEQLPDQPHIKCPELGCDKRFSQLQALKWHTIRHHSDCRPLPPSLACAAELLQADQLREVKSLDGSSVFKVPHMRLVQQPASAPPTSAKASPPKTVTVSKTCTVPTAAGQTKAVKKEDRGAPPAQGPFKPIQPKLELLEAAAVAEAAVVVNGVASDAKRKKQRRSPERPPALAPKATSAAGGSGGQRAKLSRRSDPVSPAYSDISDEGSAPLLEKEEPPATPTPPPLPPPPPAPPHSTTAQPSSSSVMAPLPKSSAATPPAAIVSPLPQPSKPRLQAVPNAASKSGAAAAHATQRGSPNAPQKPSLGHSPSEDTAKQAEERRQILAENSDIREQQQQLQHQLKETPRTPQLQSPSSCRPSSRQSVPPPPIPAAAFMGAVPPHPMAPPPPPPQSMPFPSGPGGFPDYRLLSRGFEYGQFLPPFLPDKAALEAFGYGRSPFLMQQQLQQQHHQQQQQQQHKIHELAAGSVSPGPGKTPPAGGLPHHPQLPPQQQQLHMPPSPHSLGPFHRAGLVDHFMMAPPFSIPSPMMSQPHFLPHK